VLLVDSSVWIDLLRGRQTPQTQALSILLGDGRAVISIADLVLFEVLRGVANERSQAIVRNRFSMLNVVEIGGEENALNGAMLYRRLRGLGRTIASAVDLLQASYCVKHNAVLLHSDQDFDIIERHFGLQVWRAA
jgi:predicted nucleic acid-binding protein